MSPTATRALVFARPVILILTIVNIVYASLLTALLTLSFLLPGWPERALGFDIVNKYPHMPGGLRAIVVLGVISAVIMNTILRRLLAIVDTVRDGDPFILDNAERLESIAWRVLVLELMRMVIAGVAALVWEPGRIAAIELAPWLAILLLFVLAGVFSHGARLRADLEGTV